MKKDKKARKSLLKSYQMMLDFYGMKLKSLEIGEVERSENYKGRYSNLIKYWQYFLFNFQDSHLKI